MDERWEAALLIADSQWASAVQSKTLRASTRARYRQVLDSFVRFALAMGVTTANEVTDALCLRFLAAPLRGGEVISPSTARVRLTVLRSAFDTWIAVGAVHTNPAVALQVKQVAGSYQPRPLTPVEVTRLLMAGRTSPVDTLRPASIAMALTGATHDEIAYAVVGDLDLAVGLIRLGAPDHRRSCVLPSEGVAGALERRVRELRRTWRRRSEPWDPQQMPWH